jgi:hypothetical protein
LRNVGKISDELNRQAVIKTIANPKVGAFSHGGTFSQHDQAWVARNEASQTESHSQDANQNGDDENKTARNKLCHISLSF